jgi:hypothetical protein
MLELPFEVGYKHPAFVGGSEKVINTTAIFGLSHGNVEKLLEQIRERVEKQLKPTFLQRLKQAWRVLINK